MASDNSNRKVASQAKASTKEKEPALLVPPEERFWKRYSPNHELPLSSASSALMHLCALAFWLWAPTASQTGARRSLSMPSRSAPAAVLRTAPNGQAPGNFLDNWTS